jgi:hypothetical protein
LRQDINCQDRLSKVGKGWIITAKYGEKDTARSFAEAAAFGEIIIIATLERGRREQHDGRAKEFCSKGRYRFYKPHIDFQKGIPSILAIDHTNSGGELCSAWCETLEQSRPLT